MSENVDFDASQKFSFLREMAQRTKEKRKKEPQKHSQSLPQYTKKRRDKNEDRITN